MSMTSVLQQINAVRKLLVKYINEAGGNVPQTASMLKCTQQLVNLKPLPESTGQFYKCASVDPQAMIWTGYKAIQSRVGLAFQQTQTTGLIYTQKLIPQVDSLYSKHCTYELTGYWNVLQGTTLSIAAQKVQLDVNENKLRMQVETASYNQELNKVNIKTD